MPLMMGLGWRWEGVWECFMHMTDKLDCKTRSGSEGPPMSLSDSSVGSNLWPTSKDPRPQTTIWGRPKQVC